MIPLTNTSWPLYISITHMMQDEPTTDETTATTPVEETATPVEPTPEETPVEPQA